MKKNILLKFPIFNLFYNKCYKTNNFIFIYYNNFLYTKTFIKLFYIKENYYNKLKKTHCSKRKGLIITSGKKIRVQKKSGLARARTIASPNWRGGSVVFGPCIKNFNFKLNVKEISKIKILFLFNKRSNLLFIYFFKNLNFYNFLKSLGIIKNKQTLYINLNLDKSSLFTSFFYLKSKDYIFCNYFIFFI